VYRDEPRSVRKITEKKGGIPRKTLKVRPVSIWTFISQRERGKALRKQGLKAPLVYSMVRAPKFLLTFEPFLRSIIPPLLAKQAFSLTLWGLIKITQGSHL